MIEVNKKMHLTGHTNSVYALLKYNEKYVLSGGGDGKIVKWNIEDENDSRLIASIDEQVFCLLLLPSETIACGTMNGVLNVLDMKTKKLAKSIKLDINPIYSIIECESNLVVSTGSGELIWLDMVTFNIINRLKISTKALRCLCLHNGKLMVGCSDSLIYSVDIFTQKVIKSHEGHGNSVFTLTSNNDDMMSGSRDAQLKIWTDDIEKTSLAAHLNTINKLTINPNKTMLASASRDRTIKIWNLNYELIKVIDWAKNKAHAFSVNNCVWMNNETLVSCSDDKTVQVFELITV
jgi:WD40 repeat protein